MPKEKPLQVKMEEANFAFAEYLQQYTAASLSLLGRWPAFVPEADRVVETLTEEGIEVFVIGPELPEHLKFKKKKKGAQATPAGGAAPNAPAAPSAPAGPSSSTAVAAAQAAAAAASSGGGSRGGSARAPSRAPAAAPPKSAAPPPSRAAAAAAAAAAADDDDEDAVPREEYNALKENLDRMQVKLREEVNKASKTADENMRRGMQLQATQRECAALQEAVRRMTQQLEHSRNETMALEEKIRGMESFVGGAEDAQTKERKQRYIFEQRVTKLEKQVLPLQTENATLKDTILNLQELMGSGAARSGDLQAKITKLEADKAVLVKAAKEKVVDSDRSREERAHKDLQLTLMADRRDELLETVDRLEAEAEEAAAALAASERARHEGEALAQEARRLQGLADAQSGDAAEQTRTAWTQAREAKQRSEEDRAEMEAQRQHAAALLTQDALREAEQRKLFDAVSELLARIQYLGEIPPHQLGMSKAESLQHRDEAIRHLKFLREAHALSTFPPQLVLNQATMATGAAILAANTAANGSAAASPRRRGAAGGAGGGGLDATTAGGGGPTKGRRATSANAANAPKEFPAAGAATERAGFTAWRAEAETSIARDAAGAGGPLSARRPSPRGRPRGDPARPAKGPEPAAEWEKEKLLDVMRARD